MATVAAPKCGFPIIHNASSGATSSSGSSSRRIPSQFRSLSSIAQTPLRLDCIKLATRSSSRSTSLQASLLCPPSPPSPSSSSVSVPELLRNQHSTVEQLIESLQSSILSANQSQLACEEQSSPSTSTSTNWEDNPLWSSSKSFTGLPRVGVPELELNPFQRLASAALDAIEEHFIPRLEGSALPSTADPSIQLQGNFSPVPECPPEDTALPVIRGAIPAGLSGLYVRNGANPRFKPRGGHHLFDGDGMLHGVRISPDGTASYAARFTRTHRLCCEERLGRAVFPKPIGELHGHAGLARLLLFTARSALGLLGEPGTSSTGPANAGVVFFDGKLLAMSEDDQPYAIEVTENGDFTTMGRYDFHGQLPGSSMLAHPKKDAATGELFNLAYDVVKKPYVRYFCFGPGGEKRADVEIPIEEPTMIHDFAITERFVVVPDQQVVFRLARMLSGESPVVYDPEKKSRFGVLPKYGAQEGDLRWVEVPDCFCLHVWNAWEENNGDEVVVLASCMTPPDAIFNEHKQEMSSVLCEIRLNLVTGTSTRTPIADVNLEAGTVNKHFLGKKSRYLYLAIAEPWPKVSGIAKVDLQKVNSDSPQQMPKSCITGRHFHGESCFGGEPFFVPRSSDPDAAEDDGYVLTYVHNEATDRSELRILDASTDDLKLLAAVELPSRVPYGFHGTFVSEEDLASQHS